MTYQSWFLYLSLVFVATATPGPAVLFVVTNSTLHGWRKTTYAALGNIIGLLCLGVIAVTGLGAILKTSVVLFNIVKYAGAAYLIYLGVKLFFQKGMDLSLLKDNKRPNDISSKRIFFQALAVALSNPKAIIFLTALFPQFVNTSEPVIPQFSLLIAVLMLFSFSFLMFYSLVAHKAKSWLFKRSKLTIFNRFSGTIFIGFGFLLATSSNK